MTYKNSRMSQNDSYSYSTDDIEFLGKTYPVRAVCDMELVTAATRGAPHTRPPAPETSARCNF